MFPNYKKTWYGWKVPNGWEDLGKIAIMSKFQNGENIYIKKLCPICFAQLHIGKQNNVTFRFCKRCLKKYSNK